ncbi:Eco57I restriction-modification methylase domain-containing protein [Streptomyces clavuligerus]|uniref:Eco57I restriction-modification methylase domain-containing protein n=1 Tax=Streptomyces clavuligerus TaxID=1901 RepID=UPI000185215C|nr:DNA methylase [Streptomyces clavuligerus]WDN56196.1 DNA methylase [Streptomyces clavuligerus]
MTTCTLPPASYNKLATTVARDTGQRPTAAFWIHAAALVRHAHEHGLAPADDRPPGPDGLLKSLESLARCHPALAPLADPAVLPLWERPLGEAAWAAVEEFWDRHPALESGQRVDGYALGDTYQLLSEEARKGRALCQTPPWVARLLLRLSLEPAMEEWGPADVRMIDPACGTGHIAVAAFHMARVATSGGRGSHPGWGGPRAVERALAAVSGVDLDPYAAALTAYRLLSSSASVLGLSLDRVPASWPVNVAVADSLLDRAEPLLAAGAYHACVANPPYITPKDPAVRGQVRAAYPQVAVGKYSLSLPFTALMLERLAVPGGFVAQLTSNAFMKREFGRRYITEFLPRFDSRWIIDTSGAYIPGHGTPTCILVHRARPPVGDTVTVIRGNRGEPRVPEDPAQGFVWRAIEDAVENRLARDRFQAAADSARQGEPTNT